MCIRFYFGYESMMVDMLNYKSNVFNLKRLSGSTYNPLDQTNL